MYYEILKIIDPDKQSLYSGNSAQSSTSISSFSSSFRELNSKYQNNNRNKKDMSSFQNNEYK